MPIRKATLDHLQASYTELINAVTGGLIGKTYGNIGKWAVIGVQNSTPGTSTFTISAGFIMYNGTLYAVDSQVVSCGVGQTAVAVHLTSYDATDPTQFTDSNSYNIHETKKIRFSPAASGSGLFDYNDLSFLEVTPDYVGSSTGVAYGTGFDDGGFSTRIYYGKNRDGLVTIEGKAYANGTPAVTDAIFTLPAALWPSTTRSFPVAVTSGFTYVGIMVVNTTGKVYVLPTGAGWPNGASFDNDDEIYMHASFYRNF